MGGGENAYDSSGFQLYLFSSVIMKQNPEIPGISPKQRTTNVCFWLVHKTWLKPSC